MYDFESLVPPIGANSHMRRSLVSRGITDPDVICYGIAEMKFPVLPAIANAISMQAHSGVLGYIGPDERSLSAVCAWMKKRHDWDIEPDWIVSSYGVVSAISAAIRAFSNPGDGVIIQTPVYNPFAAEIEHNGRRVVENPLVKDGDRYVMDIADLEAKAAGENVSMIVLCSPHNPVGRVWSRAELEAVCAVAEKYNLKIVSDEIHHDLDWGVKHTVFNKISEYAAQNTVVCTAASKTFNIAGLLFSAIVVQNPEMREKFAAEVGHYFNPLGVIGATAAYEKGEAWLGELHAVLRENAALLKSEVERLVPAAKVTVQDGTYLGWVDLTGLGLSEDDLQDLMTRAQLGVNMGAVYGTGGEGHVRVNFGCPKRYVIDFAERLAKAVNELK